MRRRKGRDWLPLWSDKWIFGSTRIELSIEERAIWVDLLALGTKDDGYIRANETTPYSLEQLGGLLIIPVDKLKSCIEKLKTKKIDKIEDKNGILYIKNWEEYQLSDRHTKRIEDKEFMPKYSTLIPCPTRFSDMATKEGYVRKSRLLMAIAIDRSLGDKEEVCHINGQENDDKVENLMLFATHKDSLQFQHGQPVIPLFDGSKADSVVRNAITSNLTALSGVRNDTLSIVNTEEPIIKDTIDNGTLEEGNLDELNRKFSFCNSPSMPSKLKKLRDLRRQEIPIEFIENYTTEKYWKEDFYKITSQIQKDWGKKGKEKLDYKVRRV